MKKNVVISNSTDLKLREYANKNGVTQSHVIESGLNFFLLLEELGLSVAQIVIDILKPNQEKTK